MVVGLFMQKTLAFLMTALLLLAGCTEPTEDSVADVIEEIIPGCNDETAYNYNESAGNDLACLSEEILIQAVNDFIKLMDEGPAAGETAGYTDTWSGPMNVEGEMMDADVLETAIISPEGVYFESSVDLSAMMTFEEKWWVQPTTDGTMIYVDYNGEKFSMTSATSYEDVMRSIMDDDDMQDDETSGREDSSNEDAEPGIEPEELLQVADSDNSDSMSLEEFFAYLEEVGTEGTEEMYEALKSAYVEADDDQSGELTVDELNSFILSVDIIFEEMDEDTGEDEVFICDNGDEIPFDWVNDGEQDCSDGSDENGMDADGSDENGDAETGIDLSAYDFSSANFSLLMNPMDAVSAFAFSAEMTVFDSEIHTVTITVNALFEMRSIQVDIDANDESGTFTLHTLDEMTAILEANMSSYASTEALPFTVEQDWSGNSFESMTNDEDGSPVFLTLYVCMEGVDATMIGNSSVMEVWNDTSLDTSLCDTEVMDGHIFAENETFNLPLEFFINDIFNGVASSVAHDGMNLTITYALDSESAENCTENGGTYDSTMNTSLCTESIVITQSDSQAFELDPGFSSDGGVLYQYDNVTGSILLITAEDMFECDTGELINSSQWNDGMLDCSDGSDESDSMMQNHSFSSVYDEITWETTGFKFSVYEDIESFDKVEFGIVLEEEYYTNENPNVKFLHSMGEETFSYDEDGVFSVFYGITMLEEQADLEGYSYEDQCHIIIAMAYDSNDTMTGRYSDYVCFYDENGNNGDMSVYTIMAGDAPFLFEGAAEDYSIVLSYCDSDYDDDGTEVRTCEEVDDVGFGLKDAMTSETDLRDEDYMDAMAEDGQYIFFVDADDSGTLSDGDMIYISNNGGVEESWNTVRLYSSSADAYSDENPSLPGFTGMLATLSLLGAAFVRRQEA